MNCYNYIIIIIITIITLCITYYNFFDFFVGPLLLFSSFSKKKHH